MRNSEKYKTAQERSEAFRAFCDSFNDCKGCPIAGDVCNECEGFAWLDLEFEEEKPLPCPFCGGECKLESGNGNFWYDCICGYSSKITNNGNEAISAHNRVAKAVKEIEVNHANA